MACEKLVTAERDIIAALATSGGGIHEFSDTSTGTCEWVIGRRTRSTKFLRGPARGLPYSCVLDRSLSDCNIAFSFRGRFVCLKIMDTERSMRHVLNFKNKKAVPRHRFYSYRESGLVQHRKFLQLQFLLDKIFPSTL